MRALVIDDSRTTRKILMRMLNKMGFETVEAADGREGLDRLKEMGASDLVLVDWNMPVMDGFDFVRAVRAEREYDSVPLVMVTTHNDLESVAQALEAGATEFIMKPFTEDVIREKLALVGTLEA
ncbi:MAG TPA: response regulator [Terriglobia bacterium]|nr:response regulator [Terriglobia bacterium]